MRTPNTLHVVPCAICGNDALATMPTPGNKVKGYCPDHLTSLHESASLDSQTAAGTPVNMTLVLASLGR